MKKVSLLLLITMILTLAFSSCTLLFMPTEPEEEEQHEHVYDDYLSYNSVSHYYSCECGEFIDEATHEDEEGNDGVCDECGYQMYEPIPVYTVNIVASEGVAVSKNAIQAEEGTGVSFTATISDAYKLVVSGAGVVGEPKIADGKAVYTLRISTVKADITVNVSCEPIIPPCEHEWTAATCEAPKTCGLCGETQGEALGHKYDATVVEPTCTKGGYTSYLCSGCGDSYVEDETDALGHTPGTEADCTNSQVCTVCGETLVNALGHDYGSVVTAPTCTEAGYTTYTCHCGDTYVADEVDALGHTLGAEADCTNAQVCTVCGATLADALGHSHEAVVIAPTCTEAGYTTYTCHCGDTYVADEVDALGHSYESVVTAPTCTEAGYTTYTCHCGDTYVADEVDALGHSYESVVTAPTCTEAGYTTYTCHCGDTYVADEVDALGHSYESVVTAPTCTEDGYTTYTCHCGDTYVADVIDALGHSAGDTVVENEVAAKCTTAGSYDNAVYCTVCSAELSRETITVDAPGHSWIDATCTMFQYCSVCETLGEAPKGHSYAPATCTDPKTCTVCGAKNGNPLGHKWVNATCDTPKTCSVCSATEGDVAPHAYVAKVTAPTCTEGGYTTYTCSACDDSYVANETPANGHNAQTADCLNASVCTVCGVTLADALGHSYSATVKAPTCTNAGFTTYVCDNCGDTYIGDSVPATGHSGGEATCENAAICAACGEAYADPIGHSYEATVTAPTCTAEGYTTHTCLNCGDSYNDTTVPAKGHSGGTATCEEAAVCAACGVSYGEPLGHSYKATVTAATCTADGYTTYQCSACGDSYVEDEVPALGHTESEAVVENNVDPGCLTSGSYDSVVYCATCSAELSRETVTVDATGHDHEAEVTDPTCTEGGYTTYTCHCGDTYVADETDPTGHTWIDATTEAPKTCSVCGVTEGDPKPYDLNIGENIYKVSTDENANSLNIKVQLVGGEVGKYKVTTSTNVLAVFEGQKLNDVGYYEFTVTEDDLAPIFTVGTANINPSRTNDIYIIVEKVVEVEPDPTPGGGSTVSGTIGEDGSYMGTLTIDSDGTYVFSTDIENAGIALTPDGGATVIDASNLAEVELTAGEYMFIVGGTSGSDFVLTYYKKTSYTVSGTIGTDGSYMGTLTIGSDGVYVFSTDIENGGIALSADGGATVIDVSNLKATLLTAGEYMFIVGGEANTDFVLTYVKKPSYTASGTIGEDGSYMGTLTVEADGTYIFYTDIENGGIAVTPDGGTTIIDASNLAEVELTAGEYMYIVGGTANSDFVLTYVNLKYVEPTPDSDTAPVGSTVSGTIGDDGSYMGTLTVDEYGIYVFSTDIENAGIAVTPDGGTTIIDASNLTAVTLTAGEYMFIVGGEANTDFVLTYVKQPLRTISATIGSDGSYMGTLTIESDATYIFSTDIENAGIALTPDGGTTIIDASNLTPVTLTAGEYMFIVGGEANSDFVLSY